MCLVFVESSRRVHLVTLDSNHDHWVHLANTVVFWSFPSKFLFILINLLVVIDLSIVDEFKNMDI